MRRTTLFAIGLVLVCATAAAETPEQIFKQVSPSVVVIHVSDAAGKPVALGSGVVIRRDTVITNCHVAQAGAQLEVSHLGRNFAASLRYADTDRDLCELSVPGLPTSPVPLASTANLQVGQRVYAIGAPEGLELTLSAGLISGLRSVAGLRYIQTTASISPGSSGGGLFDDQGRLVGITAFYLKGGENLNFALPADWIAGLPERAGEEAQATAGAQGRGSEWLAQAAALERKSDWQGLAKLSLAWVTQEPRSSVAWEVLGEARDNLQQYDKALAANQEAVRLDSQNADSWVSLGVDYNKLQQDEEALAADQEAVRLDTKNADAWTGLGADYNNLRQYDKALAAEREAVRLDPKNVMAWMNLGVGYGALQQYDKALAADREAVRLDPKNAVVWYDLGVGYGALQQYDKALAADQEAVRLAPKYASAWVNLGVDYNNLRQYDKALTAFREAVRLEPKNALAWRNMGIEYCLLGQKDRAIEVYQRLQTLDPGKAKRLFNVCILP